MILKNHIKQLLLILDGNADEMFYLHPNQGKLFVVGSPDAEIKDTYNLHVRVADGTTTSTAQVTKQPTNLTTIQTANQ